MLGLRMLLRDPRIYQIAMLATLLLYGLGRLGFAIPFEQILWSFGGALGAQWALARLVGAQAFDARSPLISALSMCLLLRTGEPWLAGAGAALAIASKFLIRARGKHVFNPTNAGLVAMLLLTDHVWVSPGQWGSATFLAFLFACLGGLVVNRAARSDVTVAFLVAFAAIVLGRSLWLGDPMPVPLHKLQSGALLLFAFFMISDPKTTPNRRAGRVLYACLNATFGAVAIFGLQEPNGLLYTLVALAPTVPLIDRLLPGRAYEWARPRPNPSEGETNHDDQAHTGAARGGAHRPAPAGAGVLRLLRGEGGRAALQ